MAKPAKRPAMVTIEVEIEVRHGRMRIELPEAEAEAFLAQVEETGGDMPTDQVPFEIDWDEVINSGDTRVLEAERRS